MSTGVWVFAVDYYLFGEMRMRRALVESTVLDAGENIARLVEDKYGHPRDYVRVTQFILQDHPRASYNRRL